MLYHFKYSTILSEYKHLIISDVTRSLHYLENHLNIPLKSSLDRLKDKHLTYDIVHHIFYH